MESKLKRVPAIDKCFVILDLLARSKEPLGISEIASRLDLNKSTVFGIAHTLVDMNVLESRKDGKFSFGTGFYVLANMAGKRSELIHTAHPYMERISESTKLSVFLGLRSDRQTILVDKVDSTFGGVKVASEIGIRMPVLAGAGIKAMLAQLADEEVDKILERSELKEFTPNSITQKERYRNEIRQARAEGVAYDREEYISGMTALAVPVKTTGKDVAAMWVVGMTQQLPESFIPEVAELLKTTAEEINHRLL